MKYINRFLAFIARNVKKAIVLAVLLVIVAFAGIMAYDFAFRFVSGDKNSTYDPNGEAVMLTIPKGSTSKDIAQILAEKGVVTNATRFRLRALLMGTENDFKYGTYTFVKGMSDEDIMEVLKGGTKQESVRITIPEGWTVEQIGDYLQEQEICLKEDFLEACNKTTYDFDYYTYDMRAKDTKRRNRLEGYLFPNTYDVIPENGPESIVARLLRQFEIEFSESDLARIQELGVTMDQVVTMASVIEKEAKLDEERPWVAAVLYNRMEQNMPWQLNSTVHYALGQEGTGEEELTLEQLEVDSRYNTYKYRGYPVGPICCPGKASINAVLYPAETDAIYFILDPNGEGTHLFTADYNEFLNAKGMSPTEMDASGENGEYGDGEYTEGEYTEGENADQENGY